MLLAAYELGDALLTALAIFFFVIWIWIVIAILMDLFRDHDISGWAKAVWVLFLASLATDFSMDFRCALDGLILGSFRGFCAEM